MINTNTSVASLLSGIYNSNATALSDSLTKIASGKRIQNPSDDFAGHIRAAGLNTDIAGYQTIKQNLQDAKAVSDYATKVGNSIVEDLTTLKNLQDQYSKTTDANQQASLTAQYGSTIQKITDTIANSYYDNTKAYAKATLATAAINATDTAKVVTVTAANIADISGATVAAIATATSAGITAQIAEAEKYVSQMTAASKAIDANMSLADTVIASKQATVSAIINVDEAQEMSKVTNLQIRQQATASMMAQANSAQSAMMRLFA